MKGHRNGVHKYQANLQAGRSITGVAPESMSIPNIRTRPDTHGAVPDSQHIKNDTFVANLINKMMAKRGMDSLRRFLNDLSVYIVPVTFRKTPW